jgi:hypothetical protein
MRLATHAPWLSLLLLAAACGGTDRTNIEMTTPPAAADAATADVGSPVAESGAEAGRSVPCPVWSQDGRFSVVFTAFSIYPGATWGLSDDDIHVLLNAPWAIAHYDGSTWRADFLPSGPRYLALSGTSASDLWVLGQTAGDTRAVVVHNDGPNGSWSSTSLDYPIAFDLTMLGAGDGLIAASPTATKGQGVVLRLSGGRWVPMPSPDLGIPYTITRLSKLDATHVYGIGHSITPSGAENDDVLAAFDGAAWTAIRMPQGMGFFDRGAGALQAVAAVSPDRIYALAQSTSTQERLYGVSADLSVWSLVAGSDIDAYSPKLTVTGGGMLVGVLTEFGSSGRSTRVIAVRDETPVGVCTVAPELDPAMVWSAPGSPNVHVFGSDPGNSATLIHTVARIDR